MSSSLVQWILDNRSWFLSGLGIALVGGAYKLIRWWLPKTSTATVPPSVTVVVQTQSNAVTAPALPQLDMDSAKRGTSDQSAGALPVPLDRVTEIKPDLISRAIKTAPLLQQVDVAKRYQGLKIEWDTKLLDARDAGGGLVSLLLYTEPGMFSVQCTVRLSDYQVLGLLKEHAAIRVAGTIEEASERSVRLVDVRLTYLELPKV
jgi:hypothetical protein